MERYLILDIQTTFRPQKPHCKNFQFKYIKKEICKSYFGNKEQKAMFPVVFLAGHALRFCLLDQLRVSAKSDARK